MTSTNPIIQELCRRCLSNDRAVRDVSLQSLPLFSISQLDVEQIVTSLKRNKHVTSVDLTTQFSEKVVSSLTDAVINMLEVNTTITRISIACCEQILDPLLKGMVTNRNIRTLTVGEATLHDSLPSMSLSRQWEMALRINKNLTRLVLRGMNLSITTIQAFGSGFQSNKALHSLEFCQVQLESQAEWSRLYQSLANLSSLHVLHFISCKSKNTELYVENPTDMMGCLENLYELRCIDHGDKSIFPWLAKSLPFCRSLRNIDLRGNHLKDVTELSRALSQVPGFRKLVLEDNELDCNAAIDLCRYLFTSTSLRSVNLRDNKIGAHGAWALASFFNSGKTGLEVIDVSANPIGSQGIAAFGMMLVPNTTLSALHLESVGLDCSHGDGQSALQLLAIGMAKNSSIQKLCLGGNRLGRKGGDLLKPGLATNVGLKVLALPCCQLGDGGIASISEALENNHTLHELIIPFNDIGELGIKAIGKSLPRMLGLTKLHLEFNSFSNYDDVITGLTRNMSLEFINVMNEHFLFGTQCDPRQLQLDHLLGLNKAGRRALQQDLVCELWPRVLERAFRKGSCDALYYLIRERPDLFQSAY